MFKFFKRFLIKGKTINADIYVNKILPFAKREGRKIFGSRRWVLQQDGATSHTSNKSQKWCRNNFDASMDKRVRLDKRSNPSIQRSKEIAHANTDVALP
jgi:hypothetical protein